MSHFSNHVLRELCPDGLPAGPLQRFNESVAAELREQADHARPEPAPVPKEYELTWLKVGCPGRIKIKHNLPEGGSKTYHVSWGTHGMHCTCPDARLRKGKQGRCKHCRFVAGFIGRPDLKAKTHDPNF